MLVLEPADRTDSGDPLCHPGLVSNVGRRLFGVECLARRVLGLVWPRNMSTPRALRRDADADEVPGVCA